jgi:hypothetical protein
VLDNEINLNNFSDFLSQIDQNNATGDIPANSVTFNAISDIPTTAIKNTPINTNASLNSAASFLVPTGLQQQGATLLAASNNPTAAASVLAGLPNKYV